MFEGTIAQNLMFGYSANNDEIKSALDAVQLTSFIKTLPEGLDTKIHPEGKQLSSSNAQKILLARCIISKPRILFLENPTDKMDEETSTKIIDYLTDSKRHWTLVVASKNPKWRKQGSRIILIENGKISSDSKI